MSILERIDGERRPIRRFAQRLNRDLGPLGRDRGDVLDQVKDLRAAAAGAFENLQQLAADAADKAGDAIESIGDEASKATRDAAKDVKDATKDVKIDRNVDELVGRLRKALPTERIQHLVENLERELPSTDKGRYDRAYARGWARARTSFIVVGAAAGIVAGIAGAFLLDPRHGERRRRMLGSKVRDASQTVSQQARRTAAMASDRARELAKERGLGTGKKGQGEGTGPGTDAMGRDMPLVATAPAGLVPVMDPAATGVEPVMPYADGPVTDAASIEREPLTAPDAGQIGGTAEAEATLGVEPSSDVTPGSATADADSGGEGVPSADDDARLPMTANTVTSTLEPEAEDATITGETDDRGTWHRTL